MDTGPYLRFVSDMLGADCQQLITERLIDYIRTSVTHAGGITHLRRIFSLADLYGVHTGSHGPSGLSPVAMAAAPHSTCRYRTSGSRSTRATANPPARSSPPPTPSPTAVCIPGMRRASAPAWTRMQPCASPMTPGSCP
ncbi:MAG: Mandelate racemase/muconate lactonizing protein [Pseudonocardia sp.]|nr:Mandelate racemase/muconate lactonizing protein [Pseudonocardia sp.]